MQYTDVVIEVFPSEPLGDAAPPQYAVRVFSSPAGEMSAGEAQPFAIDRRALGERLEKLEHRGLDRAGLIALGRDLAGWLLPGGPADTPSVRELVQTSLILVGQDRGVRLRLRLPPALAELPWEYVYLDQAGGGGGMDGFLALNPRIAIVRHEQLPLPPPQVALPQEEAIEVVAALASAADLTALDLASEQQALEQILEGQEGIVPTILPDATVDTVLAKLPKARVFHFAGHGEFKREMGERPRTYLGSGALAFADQRLDAEELGATLRSNGVRLVVLGACHSGRRGGINIWGGIAPMLVKVGIPAVVANQFAISDRCAIAFSAHLYRALVGGLPIERAVTAGRIAAYIASENAHDWGVPVLYSRSPDGNLFAGTADRQVRQRVAAQIEQTIREGDTIRIGDITNSTGIAVGRDARASVGAALPNPAAPPAQRAPTGDSGTRGGDVLEVGDISGSSGVAIGSGASAQVSQPPTHPPAADPFAPFRARIAASDADEYTRTKLAASLQQIADEARRGMEADQRRLDGELAWLRRTAPTLFDEASVQTLRQIIRSARGQ